MKKLLPLVAMFMLLAIAIPASVVSAKDGGLATSNGVDILRGAWSGSLTLPDESERQINLYFNDFTPDPDNPGYSKASGYFSNDEPGGNKRSKARQLPMMAQCEDLGDSTFELVILATFLIPSETPGSTTTVLKLVGQAAMGGSSVKDDEMVGTWYARGSDGDTLEGPWSAIHLDRRSVTAPAIDLEDPTIDLYFIVDVCATLDGPGDLPPEERNPGTILGVGSNIVMDSVRVTLPDGSSLILPPYTDIFSPDVDWVTTFRFSDVYDEMPLAGGNYVFTALDVVSNPIPGVETTDVWVGVEAPDPPTNVAASVEASGSILVIWDDVPVILGSFEPAADPQLGFYQIGIWRFEPDDEGVYGANHIAPSFHLVPKDKGDFVPGQDHGLSLDEMDDGSYEISICVLSVAPEGSAGHGFEYNSIDSGQNIAFKIVGGVITILP